MGPADSTVNPWREIAWNGIRFMAPDGWEIKEIGFRYIVLETDDGPVLEVKWNRIKGTFSHHRHLKRLAKSFGKKTAQDITETAMPDAWQPALTNFDITAFSWQGAVQQGTGVLLFCPICRNATLIQFIENRRKIKKTVSQQILKSFQDHAEAPICRWAIFDIRADLPKVLQLNHYRFEPGRFELVFISKNRRFTLFRWAPASVILSGTELATFADSAMEINSGNGFQDYAGHPVPAVEWKTRPPEHWIARLGQLLNRKKYPFKQARCWHVSEKNRILGIKIEGHGPINPAEMESLCIAYEAI